MVRKKLNLILGTSPDGNGGICSVIKNYKRNLKFKNVKSKILVTHQTGKNKVSQIFIFLKSILSFFFYVISYDIKIINIQVSSYGSFYRKFFFVIFCCFFDIKYFFHIHSGSFIKFYKESNFFLKKAIFFSLHNASTIIVCSNYFKKNIQKNINKFSRIEVINNSIEDNLKLKNKNYKKKNYILFLGKLSKLKGVDDIFKISDKVIKKNKDIKFLLCGNDKNNFYFNKYINNSNKKNFIFYNWLNDKKKKIILNQSKLLILPSYVENSPVCIIEAMSVGLPVVSTKVSGIPELIIHKKSGFLYKPGNLLNLENYINLLIKNEKLRISLGKQARNIFKAKFSNITEFKKIINLYEKYEG